MESCIHSRDLIRPMICVAAVVGLIACVATTSAAPVFIANYNDSAAIGDDRYTADYVAEGLNDVGLAGFAPASPGLTINAKFGDRALDLRSGSRAVRYISDSSSSYDPTVFNRAEGTIEFWFHPWSNWSIGDASIHKLFELKLDGGASGTVKYNMTKTSDGNVTFSVTGATSSGVPTALASSSSTFVSDAYNHVAVTWQQGGAFELYFDGVLVDRLLDINIPTAAELATSATLFIGMDSGGVANSAEGIVDAFVIHNSREYNSTGFNVGDQIFAVPPSEPEIPEPSSVTLALAAGIMVLCKRSSH